MSKLCSCTRRRSGRIFSLLLRRPPFPTSVGLHESRDGDRDDAPEDTSLRRSNSESREDNDHRLLPLIVVCRRLPREEMEPRGVLRVEATSTILSASLIPLRERKCLLGDDASFQVRAERDAASANESSEYALLHPLVLGVRMGLPEELSMELVLGKVMELRVLRPWPLIPRGVVNRRSGEATDARPAFSTCIWSRSTSSVLLLTAGRSSWICLSLSLMISSNSLARCTISS
mmetsp:Transcript_42735/g.93259  ORF Transcript_42735/g.93259 Transcript_42735/m.93259 type:complete len:232 (-) Transcript_42735:1668-2363(-)